jgi:hypothetical protein
VFIEMIAVYFATWLLYALYLSYCTLRQMRDTGRLAAMPKFVRFHCWGILYAALALDIAFNIVIGTILFLELPELRRLTFTMRCKAWLDLGLAPDSPRLYRWRGGVARYVCESWLNPAEPGHC